jgi:hypothetical protein
MRSKRRTRVILGLLSLVAALLSAAALGQGKGPAPGQVMHEGMAEAACRSCHPGEQEQDRAKRADPGRCCDQNCLRCHQDMAEHHPVGAGVTEKDQVPLPLLKGDRVACISCHDPLSARTDRRSWKSQSLFSRWFSRQRVYPTYYLRMNNRDGELCKTCH